MNLEQTAPRKPIRLWPGVIAVVLQWLVMVGLPIVAPDQGGPAIVGGVVFGLVVVLWWLFFSRAAWMERIGAIVLMVIAMAGTLRLVHESIANGMMGFMPFLYAVPVLSLALIAWAAATRGQTTGRRRASHGRRHSYRVRNADARSNRRHFWRRRVGFRMALDSDR